MKNENKKRYKAATLVAIMLATTIYGTSCGVVEGNENNNTNVTAQQEYTVDPKYIVNVSDSDVTKMTLDEMRAEDRELRVIHQKSQDIWSRTEYSIRCEKGKIAVIRRNISYLQSTEEANTSQVKKQIKEYEKQIAELEEEIKQLSALLDYQEEITAKSGARREALQAEYERRVELGLINER